MCQLYHICLYFSIFCREFLEVPINIKAINKPAFEKNEDIIHSLFMLEDVYHISLKREDDSAIGLVFDSSHPSYIDIREWLQMYRLYAAQKITKEEYDDWRYKYQSLA